MKILLGGSCYEDIGWRILDGGGVRLRANPLGTARPIPFRAFRALGKLQQKIIDELCGQSCCNFSSALKRASPMGVCSTPG